MARGRWIKPEFWSDSTLGECSTSARLLFIGTWCFADDEGGLARAAKQLKAQVFPHDDLDIEPLIQELLHAGLLIEYETGGKKYMHIKNFRLHQKIDRPSHPRVPLYEPSTSMSRGNGEHSPSPHRALVEPRARASKSKREERTKIQDSACVDSILNTQHSRASAHRALDEPSTSTPPPVAETTEAQWRREAQEAMDRIQAIYPTGSNASNWTVALHHASCLVGDGFATWAELVDAVERYREYQAAHETAMNIAAHNFFDPRKQNWSQRWDVYTEADLRRDSNIEAAQQVFDNLPE